MYLHSKRNLMTHNKVAKQTSFDNFYFIVIKITLFNVENKF